jgi:hypothetical protein
MLHRIKAGEPGMPSGMRPPNYRKLTQKKAQPVEVTLKVPPKEEVLEECVSAHRATTHLNYSKNQNPVQAFSAAMRHIVDVSK